MLFLLLLLIYIHKKLFCLIDIIILYLSLSHLAEIFCDMVCEKLLSIWWVKFVIFIVWKEKKCYRPLLISFMCVTVHAYAYVCMLFFPYIAFCYIKNTDEDFTFKFSFYFFIFILYIFFFRFGNFNLIKLILFYQLKFLKMTIQEEKYWKLFNKI